MNLTDAANFRYSTKEFRTDKKIPEADFQQIKDLLRLSPSSVNGQPWHFIVANTDEGKQRISKGTQGMFVFNTAKVLDASHVIVFCAKTDFDDAYLTHLLAVEDRDGRYVEQAHKDMMNGGRTMFVNIHRNDLQDTQHWNEKQLYLNIGTALLGAAALGIDTLPMEGIDVEALNAEFGLREQGLTAVAIVSFGYRKTTDFNATLPKSRLPETEIFTLLS